MMSSVLVESLISLSISIAVIADGLQTNRALNSTSDLKRAFGTAGDFGNACHGLTPRLVHITCEVDGVQHRMRALTVATKVDIALCALIGGCICFGSYTRTLADYFSARST